jgi:hypothetical protein
MIIYNYFLIILFPIIFKDIPTLLLLHIRFCPTEIMHRSDNAIIAITPNPKVIQNPTAVPLVMAIDSEAPALPAITTLLEIIPEDKPKKNS